MNLPAVLVGKLLTRGLRLTGRQATSLPGLVVGRAFPRYLARALADLPHGVVVVSATNGKTTTTKMLATIVGQRWKVLTNPGGSNLLRGIISSTVDEAGWDGKLDHDIAILEIDEAAAVQFAKAFTPQRALLLNVSRDQLDRFGEVDTTAALLTQVAELTTGHVVLNHNDPRLDRTGHNLSAAGSGAEVHYFSYEPELAHLFPVDDALYSDSDTGQSHSRSHAEDQLCVLERIERGDVAQQVTMRLGTESRTFSLAASGVHNAQNAAAAAAMALTLGFSVDEIVAGLELTQPAFGRGQTYQVDGHPVTLHLVKNPAAFSGILNGLDAERTGALMIAINDEIADSRDVSWLWDVQFAASLLDEDGKRRVPVLICAGTRAADMANRLKYDGITTDTYIQSMTEALDRTLGSAAYGSHVEVFGSYTAMWNLHLELERRAGATTHPGTGLGTGKEHS